MNFQKDIITDQINCQRLQQQQKQTYASYASDWLESALP